MEVDDETVTNGSLKAARDVLGNLGGNLDHHRYNSQQSGPIPLEELGEREPGLGRRHDVPLGESSDLQYAFISPWHGAALTWHLARAAPFHELIAR